MSTQSKKSPSYMGWLVRLKRWGLWSILGVIVLYILAFMIEVANIPDYRGGHAYVSYSPDHRYKISWILPPQTLQEERDFLLLSAWPSNKPLAIYLIPLGWSNRFKDSWFYNNDSKKLSYDKENKVYHSSYEFCSIKKPCNTYMVTTQPDYFPDIPLPPDRWNRLLAWIFFKLHPWQDVQLKEQPM